MNEKTELSDEQILALYDQHRPIDDGTEAIAFARAVLAASPSSKSTTKPVAFVDGASLRSLAERGPNAYIVTSLSNSDPEGTRTALYLASSSIKEDGERAGPLTDKGPWVAEKWPDGRVVLQSDQFAHDVALIVNGDFADDDQRMAYAKGLSAQMNAGVALLSSPPSPLGDTPDQQEQKR